MDAKPAPKTKDIPPSFPVPAVIATLAVVGLATAGYLYSRYGYKPAEPSAITAEAKAYVRNLKLADVETKATTSYMGGDLIEVVGKITNGGDRTLRQVDLNCVFYDPYGQVVRRARVAIVKPSAGGFAPGDTRNFRLPFDDIPASWNRERPQMVIAGIEF